YVHMQRGTQVGSTDRPDVAVHRRASQGGIDHAAGSTAGDSQGAADIQSIGPKIEGISVQRTADRSGHTGSIASTYDIDGFKPVCAPYSAVQGAPSPEDQRSGVCGIGRQSADDFRISGKIDRAIGSEVGGRDVRGPAVEVQRTRSADGGGGGENIDVEIYNRTV